MTGAAFWGEHSTPTFTLETCTEPLPRTRRLLPWSCQETPTTRRQETGNELVQAKRVGVAGAASGDHPTRDGDIKLRPAWMVSRGHGESQERGFQEEGAAATKAGAHL